MFPGQLHIAFVRSDVAAGRIRTVDTSAASALPGVYAVFTAEDLNPIAGPMWTTTLGPQPFGPELHPLADGDVRFVGDPIAVVVADNRYAAEDACELVRVDIDQRDAVVTIEQALADDAPIVHAELVVTRTFTTARTTNAPMECRGLVASFEPHDGRLRIWPSTQSPHEMKAFAARLLQVPENRIRVELADVGGGFGQKMYPTREEAAVLLAAKLLGRTVGWVEDRRENLIAANQARHDQAGHARHDDVPRAVPDTDGSLLDTERLHEHVWTGAIPRTVGDRDDRPRTNDRRGGT